MLVFVGGGSSAWTFPIIDGVESKERIPMHPILSTKNTYVPTKNVLIYFLYTPWKFNIAPENLSSQKESSLPIIIFQGRTVKLRGCIE